MPAPSILVVDNEKGMREFLSIALGRAGYRVTTAGDGKEALKLAASTPFDLVITDIKMKDVDGIQVLRGIKESTPDLPVILITAYASPGTAIEAMKLGAYDYISKPFKPDQLLSLVSRAIENRREGGSEVSREILIRDEPHSIIGDSPPILEICKTIGRVANSKTTILIRGESGTGKELVARAIHFYSHRKDAPFVVVNCGALSDELTASELFGHVKGSFTGAIADKPGLLEMANGGTFFFDEIGDAPLPVQVKLLRILQEQEFRRLGGTVDIRVDVRIIAATNQDLEEKIAEKGFRQDLFFRLNVISLTIPPLRERSGDVPLLVDYFIRRHRRQSPHAPGRIAPRAVERLKLYPWPGNIRELENVIERALVLEPGDIITERSIPLPLVDRPEPAESTLADLPPGGLDLAEYLAGLERAFIARALERAGGDSAAAAGLLHLKPRAFRYLLEKHDLSVRDFRRKMSPKSQISAFGEGSDEPGLFPDDE